MGRMETLLWLIHNGCSHCVLAVRARNASAAVHTYGEALLAHAKVYHLAHYKAIDPLRALALQRMDHTLDQVNFTNGLVALVPIVEFVRYVYANTDHLDNHEEPLRRLVSNFVARNFQAIQSAPSITRLLSEGGDIVMDVMMAVSKQPSPSQPSALLVPRYAPRYIRTLEVCGPYLDMGFYYIELTPCVIVACFYLAPVRIIP